MWKDRLKKRKKYIRSRRTRRVSVDVKNSRRILRLAKFAFIGVILLFIASFFLFPLLAFNLPSPDKVVRREGFSTKILDRNGEILYDIYQDERRTPVVLEDIPEDLRNATIAIEDKNFYRHSGYDPFGMARGLFNTFFKGKLQGGSTLTQQLVKNVLLTPERTIFRKIKEFVLATQIERKYSKDEILQMYLNEAPYGGTAVGVEAAAEVYYGKNVNELTLVESAVLAGLPQRPSVYSPLSSTPDAYIGRTQQVLRRMREDDYITKEDEEKALEEIESVKFLERGASFNAPHFVQYVQKILEERYGASVIERGGLIVTTTLDLELHDKAQEIVAEEIEKVEDLHITNGAAVIIDPETGEILSMVGSKEFNDPDYDGQVNVTVALRQPGSAIKPITYVTALKEGYSASTMIMDVPTQFPGGVGQEAYKPENYDGKYRGPMQIRYALANSINVVAVKTMAMVGIEDTLETAYDLGLTSLEPTKETLERVGLSLTLGGGEVRLLDLTGAYSAFMNEGYRVDPVAILKVEDLDGKVLEEVKPKKGKRVISEEEAFIIADILSDDPSRSDIFGAGSLLNIPGRDVAVKTGTTNKKRDNWTIGGNSQAVVGVWVGNNDNTPMIRVASGTSGASPIWRKIILEALSGKPNVSFKPPKGIVTAMVDTFSGYRAHNDFPSRQEYFIKGTVPEDDPVHTLLKVCKSDGRLATPSDISSGNYEEKEYFVIKEEDPTAGPGGENMWQKAILNWTFGQTDSRYHPPTEYCGTDNPVGVNFVNPGNESSDLNNTFDIKIRADSTHDIVRVELFIDGSSIKVFDGPPYERQVTLEDGVHKLKAKAKDSAGNESETEITIGVKVAWDYTAPTPTPSPTPSSTPTTTSEPTPTP